MAWVLAAAFHSAPVLRAAAPMEDFEAQELVACRRNLQLISDGIRQFQKDHQDNVPDWLSDLLPNYLSPELLTCPTARRKGRTSVGETGRTKSTDPRFPTSYFYEFNPGPASGTPPRSNREMKLRQMEQFGGLVPIVRCLHLHATHLNLSIAGTIYESGLYWEARLTNGLSPPGLAASVPPARDRSVRLVTVLPRSREATPLQIDLGEFFNASLFVNWWAAAEGGQLHALPTGAQEFDGVTFDVRGVIQLASDQPAARLFPRAVPAIPIHQKCRRLHLLHGTIGPAPAGAEVARLVLHYPGSARAQLLSIRYGEHVVQSWTPVAFASLLPSHARLAWEKSGVGSDPSRTISRLYHMSAENPLPELSVQTVDYVSALTNSAPFVLAITLEP